LSSFALTSFDYAARTDQMAAVLAQAIVYLADMGHAVADPAAVSRIGHRPQVIATARGNSLRPPA
jgi:hypothetical protein